MTVGEALGTAFLWYAVLSLVGVLTYPYVYLICSQLWDRGLSLHRPFSLATLLLPFWIIGNISPISVKIYVVIAFLLVAGVAGWFVAYRFGDISTFLLHRWRTILVFEIASLALFLGYVLFRGFKPDISGTEKPMELAFLNASIRSGTIPVKDPWFAGEWINYYDFGYVVYATIARITSISGEISFNLALASVFAMSVVAASGLAANLSVAAIGFNRWLTPGVAVLSGFIIGFAGNLYAAIQFIQRPARTLDESWWSGIGWSSSRVIEDSGFTDGSTRTLITEFPAFSWILGDLHPHVIAYPWFITAFALACNLAFVMRSEPFSTEKSVVAATVTGLFAGVLYGANTWDVPIIAILVLLALVSGLISTRVRSAVFSAVAATIGFLVTATPFFLRYDSPVGGTNTTSDDQSAIIGFLGLDNSIGYVAWDRSSIAEILMHWGALLALAILVLGLLLAQSARWSRTLQLLLISATVIAFVLSLVFSAPVLVILGIPLLCFCAFLWTDRDHPGVWITVASVSVALIVITGTEFLFVRDIFGDRMNTVFKISFQAWALLSISLPAMLSIAISRLPQDVFSRLVPVVTFVIATTMVVTSVYTPISLYRWSGEFQQWSGIDGLAYFERSRTSERAAIDWLSESGESIEVILEAPGCSYGSEGGLPHNRVSMATGIPTVFGWEGHEHQWRRGQPQLAGSFQDRVQDVRMMYESPGASQDLFENYGVTHVYIGIHETAGLQSCDNGGPYLIPDHSVLTELGWRLVYETPEESDDVRVYRVS